MLTLYGRRLLSRKLLKGMWLTGIYRRTERNFTFLPGRGGGFGDVAAGGAEAVARAARSARAAAKPN